MNFELLESLYGHTSDRILSFAPGRVNLMGDHTDYNQGFVLPITLEQGVYVTGAPRADLRVRAYSQNFKEEVDFGLNDPILRGPLWHNFVRGVTGMMHNRFKLPHGFDIVIYGDVPIGSGLSSSAAIEVALLLFIEALYNIELDPVQGALLCQAVEHEVIGVQCGIMDQFASRLGKAGHALFLDCRSRTYEHLPVELGDHSLLIVDSQVPRSLAASKYNERRDECDRAVAYFQRIDDEIDTLRDVSVAFFADHMHELLEPWKSRTRHVVLENDRVLKCVQALRAGYIKQIGTRMNESHASLRDDYEVSCTELDFLVSEMQNYEGVLGVRLTGAGFGGCLVGLVHTDAIPDIKSTLTTNYHLAHHRAPRFLEVKNNLEAYFRVQHS